MFLLCYGWKYMMNSSAVRKFCITVEPSEQDIGKSLKHKANSLKFLLVRKVSFTIAVSMFVLVDFIASLFSFPLLSL